MVGEKRTLYRRTYIPMTLPILDTTKREPVGSFMNGAEHQRVVNGKITIIVKLQDGGEEPLSELVTTEIIERRKVERHPHLYVTQPQPSAPSSEPRGTDSLQE